MRRIKPPDDLPRFFVLKRTLGYDACLRLSRRIEISTREMQPLEQRVTAASLLRSRSSQRLKALVKRVVPRGN